MPDVITNRRLQSQDTEIHAGDVDAPDGYHTSVMIRIVGDVILVCDRRWTVITRYELDAPAVQHRNGSFVGLIDGIPIVASTGCGCANQPTTFTPKGV